VTIQYTHKKQTGGSGQFAQVTIAFEPLPPDSGFVFENAVLGGAIPKEFIPSVEEGLRVQKESGPLAGFPVVDFKATLVDGKYHEMDSSPLAFEVAARAAFRDLAPTGVVRLLEPVMQVEVVTPEESIGSVIADLIRRRGKITGSGERDGREVVSALV